MGPSCPPPWTIAGRAACFGDRICAFCDHHNPAGAKFCNDCGAPLQLKPCKQCDAVIDEAATSCYQCGAACPASSSAAEAGPVLPGAGLAMPGGPSGAAPEASGDVAIRNTPRQPPQETSAAGWRSLQANWLLVAAITALLVAGAYDAYRGEVAAPDAGVAALQPLPAPGNGPSPQPLPMLPVMEESAPVDAQHLAVLEEPLPPFDADAPQRPGARHDAVPPAAPKRAGAPGHAARDRAASRRVASERAAPRRGAPDHQAAARATSRQARSVAAARPRARARVAQTGQPLRRNHWQLMRVSLARCGGNPIAHLVCDQRVRQHFCEDHWGEAPHCASVVVNEHGQ